MIGCKLEGEEVLRNKQWSIAKRTINMWRKVAVGLKVSGLT